MIRLMITELHESGEFRILESLHQTIALGRDTFTSGAISRGATEECVDAIRRYTKLLAEYQITDPARIRAVATSAVREAANREAFLDRIYVATGIVVQVLEEPAVIRLTYTAIMPCLQAHPDLMKGDTIVVEVGAGSTELMLFRDGVIAFADTYRLGAIRMREMLGEREGPGERLKGLIETHVQRPVQQLRKTVPVETEPRLMALGGDMRFAATQLKGTRDSADLTRVKVSALSGLAETLLALRVDDVVKQFKITYTEAETLGPTLQTYLHLARAFRVKEIHVPEVSLRDGIAREMSRANRPAAEFLDQIVKSAYELGRKYQFDEAHGRHVAELAEQLFEALGPEHRLGPQHLLLLRIAGLLHEIGLFVSTRSHHKHSMYLILNSELFGLDRASVELIALTARYHRRAGPRPIHEIYATLPHESRIVVSKLAAILRVADALDRAHNQRIAGIRCAVSDRNFVITVPGVRDLTLEQLALKQKGSMFEGVYGLTPVLRRGAA